MIAVDTNILVHAHRADSPWRVRARSCLHGLGGEHSSRVAGPRVHDARIAALCVQHGVTKLWTMDRDFSRFALLSTEDPLTGQ
jgi:predicted nucleic acid-binding protein